MACYISEDEMLIQDCHTIFNTRVEDIKDIKDKLPSNLIKITALYDMILKGDINLEKIAAAFKIDLAFIELHGRSEFAYHAGCKGSLFLPVSKDDILSRRHKVYEIKDTCSKDCPCVIDSFDYEHNLKLHLAVAYIPIVIANTSQNPMDVVQVGKDEIYTFEAGKGGRNVSIRVACHKINKRRVQVLKNEICKKMIDMGFEVPGYKFNGNYISVTEKDHVCVNNIVKSMKYYNLSCNIKNGIVVFYAN